METQLLTNFDTASRAVLLFLHKRMGFDLWMVTRTEGDDWIVLQSEDHGYGVDPGNVFKWADSFCSEMVKGNGPRIAPHSDSIPAYAAAPIGLQVDIKAYVGFPLTHEDGSLFGTLCAIDPSTQPESISDEQELIELVAAMLSILLQTELRHIGEVRRSEHLQAAALKDEMTNLYNRRGWDNLLSKEEERSRRYGNPAAVFIIDLDGLKNVNDTNGHAAGDELLVRAAAALQSAARPHDVVARLGGDEFGILSVECDLRGGEAMLKRIKKILADSNISASIGLAMRDPEIGLHAACERADRLMYEEKRTH